MPNPVVVLATVDARYVAEIDSGTGAATRNVTGRHVGSYSVDGRPLRAAFVEALVTGEPTRCLTLTTEGEEWDTLWVRLPKDHAPVAMLAVGRKVEQHASPRVAKLTPRELSVVQMSADDLPPVTIAARLGVKVETVYSHRRNIAEKLGCRTWEGAVAKCVRAGVV